ncbi:MAG TPA: class I SAM-dependent methyltransferase [Clostridia bacterium]|nr:class I SAM-dependent methyltransferase [Clostridia bacterium]
MIIHKLLLRHFRHGDDPGFYLMQAQDAIRWLQQVGVRPAPGTTVLDLGCGHGVFGAELKKCGCEVTFADRTNYLLPELRASRFIEFEMDKDDLSKLGTYDLVICSNVFEHLVNPDKFLQQCASTLKPNGVLYLSWTNWLSPFGGHDFAPLHYLGPRNGQWLFDKLLKRHRNHTIYENLFPTYIGQVLRKIRRNPSTHILHMAPRYYTEFAFLLRIPILREFLAWNCALVIGKK